MNEIDPQNIQVSDLALYIFLILVVLDLILIGYIYKKNL